ncbi:MAG TPA: hypothetical protein VNW29_07875 [Candidatus Sulfotelmatobacter sp.]|nr:hypothetical protein [Candidatus Sulfotelmatobacter sp.]
MLQVCNITTTCIGTVLPLYLLLWAVRLGISGYGNTVLQVI